MKEYFRCLYTVEELKEYFHVSSKKEIENILISQYGFKNKNYFKYLSDKKSYLLYYRHDGTPPIVTKDFKIGKISDNIEDQIIQVDEDSYLYFEEKE